MNIIRDPKKTFNSFRGILILANKNEVSKSKNGTKTEINPNRSVNLIFRDQIEETKTRKISIIL